ncbi:MAG: hypothetical protein RJB47_1378, partial [Pseudomonadota bacterium]
METTKAAPFQAATASDSHAG